MEKLEAIHSKIQLVHGKTSEEFEEQKMAALFIEPHHTVLELGGNIGRNSCTIASILDDSSRLVVIEPARASVIKLRQNRDHNQFKFHIEMCAISKEKIYQIGWQSKPASAFNGAIPKQWKEMPTKSWTQLKETYSHLSFDTLVVDCEGALFYILTEEPTFLDGIQLILIENDFPTNEHKQFVDDEFKRQNFECIYTEGISPELTKLPCKKNFYETWKRKQ